MTTIESTPESSGEGHGAGEVPGKSALEARP